MTLEENNHVTKRYPPLYTYKSNSATQKTVQYQTFKCNRTCNGKDDNCQNVMEHKLSQIYRTCFNLKEGSRALYWGM